MADETRRHGKAGPTKLDHLRPFASFSQFLNAKRQIRFRHNAISLSRRYTHFFSCVSSNRIRAHTREPKKERDISSCQHSPCFLFIWKDKFRTGTRTRFSLSEHFFILLLLLRIISLLYEEAKNTVLACLLLFLLVSTNGMITGHCHNPSTV